MIMCSEICTTEMLNKNTLGTKKCEANKKQPYLCTTKSFDIKRWPSDKANHTCEN